jgi:hypothetical protein
VLSLAYVNISFALSWHIRVTFRRAFFATWRDEAAGGSSAASHEGHARAAAGAGDALAESVPGSSRCSSRAVILEDVECVATAEDGCLPTAEDEVAVQHVCTAEAGGHPDVAGTAECLVPSTAMAPPAVLGRTPARAAAADSTNNSTAAATTTTTTTIAATLDMDGHYHHYHQRCPGHHHYSHC